MAKYSTPGVYLKEIDKSEVLLSASVGGAAMVLKSPTGPMWRPITLANTSQLNGIFGYPVLPTYDGSIDYNQYLMLAPENGYGLYGAAAYLAEGSGLTVVRAAGGKPFPINGRTCIEEYTYSTATFGFLNNDDFWGLRLKNPIHEIYDQKSPNTVTTIQAIDSSYPAEWVAAVDDPNDTFQSNFGIAFTGGPSSQGDNVAVAVSFFGKDAPWRYRYDDDAKIDMLLDMINSWETNTPLDGHIYTEAEIIVFIDANSLISPKVMRIEIFTKNTNEAWKPPIDNKHYTTLESFECTLQQGFKTNDGTSLWINDVINGRSGFIYTKYNKNLTTAECLSFSMKTYGLYTAHWVAASSMTVTTVKDNTPDKTVILSKTAAAPADEAALATYDELASIFSTATATGYEYTVLSDTDLSKVNGWVTTASTPQNKLAAKQIVDRHYFVQNLYETTVANWNAISVTYVVPSLNTSASSQEPQNTNVSIRVVSNGTKDTLTDTFADPTTSPATQLQFETQVMAFDLTKITTVIDNSAIPNTVVYTVLDAAAKTNLNNYLNIPNGTSAAVEERVGEILLRDANSNNASGTAKTNYDNTLAGITSGTNRKFIHFESTTIGQELTGGTEMEGDSDVEGTTGWKLLSNPEKVNAPLLIVPTYNNSVKQHVNTEVVAKRKRDCLMIAQSGNVTDYTEGDDLASCDKIIGAEGYGYPNPSYIALYAGWAKVFDFNNDRDVWVPNCIYAGQSIARTDNVANVWDAPAGQIRGVIPAKMQNVDFSDESIGKLYDNNINAAKEFAGIGSVLWGQKTGQRKESALNRINVRRTLLFIEQTMRLFLNPLVLDVNNTSEVRLRVWTQINNFLQSVKAQGGLIDYQVICDESNNTPEVIDANTLNVDVIVRPVKTIEFIDVNVIVASTGLSFEEARVR
jgi:phage tail sheath protein FI